MSDLLDATLDLQYNMVLQASAALLQASLTYSQLGMIESDVTLSAELVVEGLLGGRLDR